MALVDTIDIMPDSFKEQRDKLSEIYKELIDSMLKFQDESGMWYQVVDKGDREGCLLYTSRCV